MVMMVDGKTKGLYFSAKALLSSVYEGALVDFDSALRIEARWFTKVLMTDTCTNMARTLFLNKSALEKGYQRPAGVKETNLKQISVIGSGMMGSGIAYASILQGLEVLLIDQNIESAEAGKTKLHSAPLTAGKKGVLHGMMTYLMQDKDGQISETHSISAGLDYPGVGIG